MDKSRTTSVPIRCGIVEDMDVGWNVSKALRAISFGRLMLPFICAPNTAFAIGPSFDCHTAHDSLAIVICSNNSLSDLDLRRAQTYNAMRAQLGPQGASSIKREGIAFLNDIKTQCGLPPNGTSFDPSLFVPCVSSLFTRQRQIWISHLDGGFAQEAAEPPEAFIDTQAELIRLGLLDPTSIKDGILGHSARKALSVWQSSQGLAASGALDNETVEALLHRRSKNIAVSSDPERLPTEPPARAIPIYHVETPTYGCRDARAVTILSRVANSPRTDRAWVAWRENTIARGRCVRITPSSAWSLVSSSSEVSLVSYSGNLAPPITLFVDTRVLLDASGRQPNGRQLYPNSGTEPQSRGDASSFTQWLSRPSLQPIAPHSPSSEPKQSNSTAPSVTGPLYPSASIASDTPRGDNSLKQWINHPALQPMTPQLPSSIPEQSNVIAPSRELESSTSDTAPTQPSQALPSATQTQPTNNAKNMHPRDYGAILLLLIVGIVTYFRNSGRTVLDVAKGATDSALRVNSLVNQNAPSNHARKQIENNAKALSYVYAAAGGGASYFLLRARFGELSPFEYWFAQAVCASAAGFIVYKLSFYLHGRYHKCPSCGSEWSDHVVETRIEFIEAHPRDRRFRVQVNEGGHSRWVSRQETWTEVREQVFDRHQCVTCDNEYEKSHYRTRKENVCTER